MNTILAAVVFIAQLICCMAVKHRVWKYTPVLLVAALMSATVLSASLGEIDQNSMMSLAVQTMLLVAGGFAVMLHMAIKAIWNRMKNRT